MKKNTILFILIFTFVKTQAQNYIIDFIGTGASTTVDTIKVENLTHCTDTILLGSDKLHLNNIISGVSELNLDVENLMHIFPNPMLGSCTIEFEATSPDIATISLYDITGKRILQARELLSKGMHTFSIKGIDRGIYTLKVESDKYSYKSKLISINTVNGIPEIKHIGTTQGLDKQYTASEPEKKMSLKRGKTAIDMQYAPGDTLKLTGISGIYRTVFILVPTQNQTVAFNFVACTDADNNNYSVVRIGTQVWMAENLRATKYRNGDSIGTTTPFNLDITSESTPSYEWVYLNEESYLATYGRIYTWYTIKDTRNIAPVGWHIPTFAEWTTLLNYLGDTLNAGGKLKENCSDNWQIPNVGASNGSGFSALPGGFRSNNGYFGHTGTDGLWWSSSDSAPSETGYWNLDYQTNSLLTYISSKQWGLSVRCIKD